MPIARRDDELELVEQWIQRLGDRSPSGTGRAPPGVKSF
jgi:hypothetical protein